MSRAARNSGRVNHHQLVGPLERQRLEQHTSND